MESPGTAPGSEPRITGAFIAIVTVARDSVNIGAGVGRCKRHRMYDPRALCAHNLGMYPDAVAIC